MFVLASAVMKVLCTVCLKMNKILDKKKKKNVTKGSKQNKAPFFQHLMFSNNLISFKVFVIKSLSLPGYGSRKGKRKKERQAEGKKA